MIGTKSAVFIAIRYRLLYWFVAPVYSLFIDNRIFFLSFPDVNHIVKGSPYYNISKWAWCLRKYTNTMLDGVCGRVRFDFAYIKRTRGVLPYGPHRMH